MAGEMVRRPAIREVKKPVRQGRRGTEVRGSLKNSRQTPPRIVGMERRKENRTASFASHPRMRADPMVAADLEIPGIRARACIDPIQKASFLTEELFLSRRRLDRKRRAAEKSMKMPRL